MQVNEMMMAAKKVQKLLSVLSVLFGVPKRRKKGMQNLSVYQTIVLTSSVIEGQRQRN